ncbi:MAG: hypothetical protein II940_04875, partial [Methanosarcinaceae archaeon]|nr:hypothetical protein [Methanosarcinaceae archaeon]
NGSLYVTNETTGESVRMYLIEKGLIEKGPAEEQTAAPDTADEMSSFRQMIYSFFRRAEIAGN